MMVDGVAGGRLTQVRVLMNNGADSAKGRDGWTALMWVRIAARPCATLAVNSVSCGAVAWAQLRVGADCGVPTFCG